MPLIGQLTTFSITMALLFGLVWALLLLGASLWLPRLLRAWTPALPAQIALLTIVALAK